MEDGGRDTGRPAAVERRGRVERATPVRRQVARQCPQAFDFAAEPSGEQSGSVLQDASSIPGFVSRNSGSASALPSHGLLNDYSPSPHAPDGPSTTFDSYAGGLPPPNYNDEIDIPKAFRD